MKPQLGELNPTALELAILCALVAVIATWITRCVARRIGFVARSSARTASGQPVVLGGGIPLVAIAAPFLVWLGDPVAATALVGFGLGGLVDDLLALPPWGKLALQGAAAVAVMVAGDGEAAAILAGLLGVVFANAVNLVDVSDGLAGGLGLIALLGVGSMLYDPAPAIIAAGTLCGVLLFNLHPASLYLGDAGAQALGGLLGALAATAATEGFAPHAAIGAIVVLGPFWTEVAFLIVIRAQKGIAPWRKSPDHLAWRLGSGGFRLSHSIAVLVLWCWGWGATVLGVAAARKLHPGLAAACVAWLGLVPMLALYPRRPPKAP